MSTEPIDAPMTDAEAWAHVSRAVRERQAMVRIADAFKNAADLSDRTIVLEQQAAEAQAKLDAQAAMLVAKTNETNAALAALALRIENAAGEAHAAVANAYAAARKDAEQKQSDAYAKVQELTNAILLSRMEATELESTIKARQADADAAEKRVTEAENKMAALRKTLADLKV